MHTGHILQDSVKHFVNWTGYM